MHKCPCEIANNPCSSRCPCVNSYSSFICMCCAQYGSEEQKKAAANRIVRMCNDKNNDIHKALEAWGKAWFKVESLEGRPEKVEERDFWYQVEKEREQIVRELAIESSKYF